MFTTTCWLETSVLAQRRGKHWSNYENGARPGFGKIDKLVSYLLLGDFGQVTVLMFNPVICNIGVTRAPPSLVCVGIKGGYGVGTHDYSRLSANRPPWGLGDAREV